MTPNAIEATGLDKTYGWRFGRRQQALDGLSLSIPERSAFGLIGPNGAGKTTFIKAMLAILRPTDGRVLIFGTDPNQVQVRARIGYLPERLHLPPSWNARAILFSVAKLMSKNPGRDAAPHTRGVFPAHVEMNFLTLKAYGHHVIFGVDDFNP